MLPLHNGQMGTVSNCALTQTWLKQGSYYLMLQEVQK